MKIISSPVANRFTSSTKSAPTIRWFGRYLPEFLHTMAPWRDHPVLAEMARFEWARGELVDAADSPVIGVEDITGIPLDRWAEIQPRLKPAVRQRTLKWDVPSLWSAINDGDTPPSPTRTEQAVHWLLWREDIRIHWRSIPLRVSIRSFHAVASHSRDDVGMELSEGGCHEKMQNP